MGNQESLQILRKVLLCFFISIIPSLCDAVATNSSSSCGSSLNVKLLTSEPAYQSARSSLLLTSPLDTSIEYLCSAGSGYDTTGITCYSLKCPATPAYGNPYSQPYGQPFGQPYGNRANAFPYQTPGKTPYGSQGQSGSQTISVGSQVAAVETAYPCWKLKQVRLNQYVYIICFVRNYPSIVYQITFKENYQLDIVQALSIPYIGLSAVSVCTYTTEAQVTCLAAFFSTYQGSFLADPLTHPSDMLAVLYTLCPNNYQWTFSGNIPIAATVDVSCMVYGKLLELFFAARHSLDAAIIPYPVLALATPSGGVGELVELNAGAVAGGSVIAHYQMSIGGELNPTDIVLKEAVISIGCLRVEAAITKFYKLCGITKLNIITKENVTVVCASVNTVLCQKIIQPEDFPSYSSFCAYYDVSTRTINREKIVFLATATEATDIQLVRATGEGCQFVAVTSLAGPLKFYCLTSIISAINNMTGTCDSFSPASVLPIHQEHPVFHSAVSCSYKSKCCNTPNTCITCNRPAKFGERYLAELSCGNAYQNVLPNVYDENNPYGLQQRGPYLLNPNGYGRQLNFTGLVQPYLQQPQLYGPNALPYMPQGPYQVQGSLPRYT